MKNLINYIKDKIYYVMGATVLIIILIIVISACSKGSGNSYESIEEKMISATKNYYNKKPNLLPNTEGGTVKVTVYTLIDEELLKEIKDPKDKNNICSGYVDVTKIGKDYSFTPFLVCKGNYEPKYLLEKIKKVKTDEYGNGVYTMNDEYVYRGDDVDNFVQFNNQLWRIIKIDKDSDIKLISYKHLEDSYEWDTAYNSEKDDYVGITSDYLHTNIRKKLNEYYNLNFTTDEKAKIVSKNICIGNYSFESESETFSTEKECVKIKEDEKVSLMNLTDYQNASLDTACLNLYSKECANYNYLQNDIYTWTLNTASENTYKVFYFDGGIDVSDASNSKMINPVIYLSNKVITNAGIGTEEDPYIIK